MKFSILLLTALFFVSCSGNSPSDNAANVNAEKAERNKQVALKNEVTKITQAAQTLEKQGRLMDSYRLAPGAESQRECAALMEERQKETKDLETRINNLPNPLNTNLTPLLADLDSCVSCAKTAMASCVKSRASINQVIKEQFQQ